MTRRTNARVAGFTFLFYIAVGLTAMGLAGRASGGEGIAAKLAAIAQHASALRAAIVFDLLGCFSALVLAVTLYAITRDEDRDLAMLGLTCRVAEGVTGAVSLQRVTERLWLATATGANAPDAATASALGAVLLKVPGPNVGIGAIFFAVGSTLFAYLLLRGRMIPVALAWLGVLASILLVVGLPLNLVGVLPGLISQLIWLPALVFELGLAVWFLVKGVAPPLQRRPA